jgi:hypothetical protein
MRVRAIYEDGDVTLAEPVYLSGCWRVEVVFLEREDQDIPVEANPHRPEARSVPDRLEELHRRMEMERPSSGPV